MWLYNICTNKINLLISFLLILMVGPLKSEEKIILPKKEHMPFQSYSSVKSGTHMLFKLFETLVNRKERWENHSHIPPSQEKMECLEKQGIVLIGLVRDIRDQLVSAAFYWNKFDNIFPEYIKDNLNIKNSGGLLSDEQVRGLIKYMISDEWLEIENRMSPEIRDFHNSAKLFLIDSDLILKVKYENLVGLQGGGDAELQKLEIDNIARHIGIKLNPAEIEYVAQRIYGGTLTFNKGLIGLWKRYFDADLCEQVKEMFGSDLIIMGYESDYAWQLETD